VVNGVYLNIAILVPKVILTFLYNNQLYASDTSTVWQARTASLRTFN